jgi:L-cysteine desulfidase
MLKENKKYQDYVHILQEELVPAMGCTEPIALAYAGAKARETLGAMPEKVVLEISGSIIKNVKSVIVPNTGHMKGIPAAVAAGIVVGHSERQLEVLSAVTDQEREAMAAFIRSVPIEIHHLKDGRVFDIVVQVFSGEHRAKVRIADYHTNIVLVEKDGTALYRGTLDTGTNSRTDRTVLNMRDIWDFAISADIQDVRECLDRQIQYNTAIAEEGMRREYGAGIGRVLMGSYQNDIRVRARAKAAAGSDARMNGCELPVIINSGSGNQGITCSVPVIEYAREKNASDEMLYRALILSNLTAIHQKTGIGTLSAYCGAVSAGAGAGAGIAYLCGGGYQEVVHTVINALAITSGIVCDGAKSSCAAKIAAAVDAAILGYEMCLQGKAFQGGDGIVMEDVEETIRGVGVLAREGMRETNHEIIKLMIHG